MSKVQDLQQKVFFEAKTILETLAKISSKEELLARQDLFTEIADRVAFLKVLEKNKDLLAEEIHSESFDNQIVNSNNSLDFVDAEEETLEEFLEAEDEMEEEVMYTNEINEISDDLEVSEEETPLEEINFEEQISDAAIEVAYEERVAEKEQQFQELEENRRKIVEYEKEDVVHDQVTSPLQSNEQQHHTEKKFKLAHIKGLKAVGQLFDEDPLEKLQEDEHANQSGSLLKTNIPTDYMEAARKRPEFRLDLNDKVAFTKLLFKGNENELNKTVAQLNSYDNLEDARQYLSEVYYEKDWKSKDEYAQRLWSLVENKFL